jgi:hypothetical protein
VKHSVQQPVCASVSWFGSIAQTETTDSRGKMPDSEMRAELEEERGMIGS